MAYDASNNQQDQNQVVSSTPLSGGQQPAAQPQGQDSQASQAPSQPSTVQSGMSSTQAGAAQQPQQTNKPASSGMFTNIQKYVQKNKPQAQKMAGAVTENVGAQASDIAQQAEKKQADMKAALDANQSAMDSQRAEAEQMVSGVMGTGQQPPAQQPATQPTQQPATQPATQPAEVTSDQQDRFAQLMSGPQGMIDVGNVNLGKESQKARALQQLAGQAGTEMGRRGLLQDTFSKQGAYTQGMGGLDQLITSGDEQARTALTQGVKQEADALNENITGMNQQLAADTGQFRRESGMFGDEIRNMVTGQMEGDQFSTLGSDYDRLKQLESDFAQNQTMDKDYEKLIAGSQGGFDNAKASLLDRIKAEMKLADSRAGRNIGLNMHNDGWKVQGNNFNKDIANMDLSNPENLAALEQKYLNPFGNKLSFGSDRDHQKTLAKKAWDQMQEQQAQQEAYNTSKGVLSDEISGLLPQTQENLSRFQQLKSLLGQEDVRNLSGLGELELAPNTKTTRTGGTGSGGGSRS